MRLTVQLFAAVLATAVALAGLAGAAVAHNTAIGSQHTMDFTPEVASDRFTGQVSSTKAFCERGRSIKLLRVVGGSSVPDQEVAKATTAASGVWSKGVGDAQAGSYYAVAAKKVVRSSGHRHVCKAATTAPLSVSPALTGLALDPATIATGGSSTGTVSLSAPAKEDLTVSLESSNATVAQVPSGVAVGQGQEQASFQATGTDVGFATITASLDGVSFTQALTVDNDNDGDGIPNSEDCAPNDANPPGETECFAPVTPYGINSGTTMPGQGVWVSNLLVTAADETTAWAGVQDGDSSWQGPEYSALTIDLGGISPAPTLQAGDRIDVLGTSKTLGVEASKVTVLSSGSTPAAHEVSTTAMTLQPHAYNAQLLKVGKISLAEHTDDGGWLLSGGIEVGDHLIGALPAHEDGSWFASVAGILDGTGTGPLLLPRSGYDITPSAVLNETGGAGEADFCNIQFPTSVTASSGQATGPIYGHLYEAGTTEGDGAAASVVAEVGFGPAGTDPRTAPGWRFTTAGFNTQVGTKDEYSAALSAPTVSSQASYSYAYRFSPDGGSGFTYCDTDGAGSGPGLDFDPGALGALTVAP